MSGKFSVVAKNGMVASSQPLATLAGVQILMNGGNAIDAAIATAAVLGVVEASSLGIGSDAFCLFYSASARRQRQIAVRGEPRLLPQDWFQRDAAARDSLRYRTRRRAGLDDAAEFPRHAIARGRAASSDSSC